jgi:hypothetical protein
MPPSVSDPHTPLASDLSLRSSRSPSHHVRHDSKISIASKSSITSNRSHQEYLDSLVVPKQEMVERIREVQERNEKAIMMRRLSEEQGEMSTEQRSKAAAVIQRNYRGHRERRMLAGMSLDPSR